MVKKHVSKNTFFCKKDKKIAKCININESVLEKLKKGKKKEVNKLFKKAEKEGKIIRLF